MIAFFILVVIPFILLLLAIDGYLGRDVMRDTENIRSDATVLSITPKKYGTKGGTHFEAIIKFSDGSWYRTKCGTVKGFYIITVQFDPDQVPDAVEKAMAAHQKVALKKEKKMMKK